MVCVCVRVCGCVGVTSYTLRDLRASFFYTAKYLQCNYTFDVFDPNSGLKNK